ncbi:MAG: hypothetical protein KH214_17285, partial [Ruminococcus sp.]|nr:hypothetical protein [Ruminococcus sp.]
SSNPRIVLSSCPPPCGHFSIQESATGGLSYKVRKPAITPVPREINRLINKGFCFIKELPLFLELIYYILLSWRHSTFGCVTENIIYCLLYWFFLNP